MYVDNRTAMIAFVALLMVATASLGLVFMGIGGSDADEREASRAYALSGTMGGAEVSGTGTCEYVEETGAGRVFQFTFTAVTGDGETELSFGIVFDLDDRPSSALYTSLGAAGESEAWRHSEDGVEYTFVVGDLCTVESVRLVAAGYDITGTIITDGGDE